MPPRLGPLSTAGVSVGSGSADQKAGREGRLMPRGVVNLQEVKNAGFGTETEVTGGDVGCRNVEFRLSCRLSRRCAVRSDCSRCGEMTARVTVV